MRSLPLLVALAATAAATYAQSTCNGPGPASVLATQNPFSGNSLYGHPNYPSPPGPTYTGFNFVFDLTLNVPVVINGVDLDFYDAGGLVNLGNNTTTTSPNQVGATTNIGLFIIPGVSWVGNENTPGNWAQISTGTATVQNPHVASPGVFTTPITLTPGLWAIAIKVDMTTSGPNPPVSCSASA